MPSIVDKLLIPKELDRRRKLTEQDKEEIKAIYNRGELSIRGIARLYDVDKRTIQFILFPDRLAKNKQDRKDRGGWRQYYDKDDWKETMKEHRQYKRKLMEAGKI